MFKVIKTTNWESSTGEKGTTLVVVHKGRVFVVNTNDFDSKDFDLKDNLLKFKSPIVAVPTEYKDAFGTTKKGLNLKPKMEDIELSDF